MTVRSTRPTPAGLPTSPTTSTTASMAATPDSSGDPGPDARGDLLTARRTTGRHRPAPDQGSAPPAVADSAGGAGSAGTGVLAVLVIGQFMALLDATIVNVAIPSIRLDLHSSGAALQLIVAGYSLAYAMLLITGARLGVLAGHRRMFVTGLVTFTLASLACGLAPSGGALIAARIVQGAGAAAMVPQTLSIIQRTFVGAARTRALSVYGAALAAGGVTGQVLGGLLVDLDLGGSTWRSVFFVNVPVGAVAFVLAVRRLPRDVPQPAGNRVQPAAAGVQPAAAGVRAAGTGVRGAGGTAGGGARTGAGGVTGPRGGLDLPGLVLSSLAVLLLVLPLVLGREQGWPAWTAVSLVAGVLLTAVFLLVETRLATAGRRPLLDLAVVRSPGLVSALIALTAGMVAYGAFLFVFAVHLQGGLGDSPLRAGLTFAPAGAAFGLVGYHWRRLPRGWHPWLPVIGFAVAALGYAAIAAILDGGSDGAAWLFVLMAFTGAGMGAGFSPLLVHGLVGVPPERAADASGLLSTVMQLSVVVGVTVFGDLFLSLSHHPQPHASASAFGTVLFCVAALSAGGVVWTASLARTVRSAHTPAA